MLDTTRQESAAPLKIAVVGTGISGMAAAWLLSQRHAVTVYEQDSRIGGHSNTVLVPGRFGPIPVDTGFIVYNERNYPNLTALFRHLDVPTQASDMSFAVSMDGGRFEYAGSGLGGLLAQPSNLLRPRFWSMLCDLRRFYREAPRDKDRIDLMTLGEYLTGNGYRRSFLRDHLLPMAAAVWSTPVAEVEAYPAAAFLRFCDNHGLLQVYDRPQWHTVTGGSRAYVARLVERYAKHIRLGAGVRTIHRANGRAVVEDNRGQSESFDHVVIATHADQALRILQAPTVQEKILLGAFRYKANRAVLHSDKSLMPKRHKAWSSWNYMGAGEDSLRELCVTYWMNRLQGISEETPLFVTLNPVREPAPESLIRTEIYEHPQMNLGAIRAQEQLWSLQGQQNTWFCGAYFGSGFHEDGLQAGLAVAETLGGMRRPWKVENESGRIVLSTVRKPQPAMAEAVA